MRSLVLFLAISSMSTFVARAQSSDPQPTSNQVLPLNENEKRLALEQLYEDERLRKKVADYDAWIEREKQLYERERSVSERELAVEKKATSVAEGERDLAQEQARTYKALYDACAKKGGCGFFGGLFRVLSLGSYRCH